MPFRNIGLGTILLCAVALCGCYSGAYLTHAAPDSSQVNARVPSGGHAGFPVYIVSVTTNQPEDASTGPYDLARVLERTGLFSNVSAVPPGGDCIEADLDIATTPQDVQAAFNIAKMALTGLSAFLLAGALPQTNTYESVDRLRVRWPNQVERTYVANCSSYSYATLDKYRAVQKSARILNQAACLNALANQMSADYRPMTLGLRYERPAGSTTSQVEKSPAAKSPNRPAPEAVCTVLGYQRGSAAFTGCLMGLK